MRKYALSTVLLLAAHSAGVAQVPVGTAGAVGRYQFFSKTESMPAVIFDTATGCVEFMDRFDLDSPKPGESRYVWVRSKQNEVMAGTPQRCAAEKKK